MLETSDGVKFKSVAEETTEQRQRNNEQRQREWRENRALAQRAATNFENAKAEAARVRVAAQQTVFEAALKESLRAAYIKSNGSEFGFDTAYPQLRSVYVEQHAVANATPEPSTNAARAKRTLAQLYKR